LKFKSTYVPYFQQVLRDSNNYGSRRPVRRPVSNASSGTSSSSVAVELNQTFAEKLRTLLFDQYKLLFLDLKNTLKLAIITLTLCQLPVTVLRIGKLLWYSLWQWIHGPWSICSTSNSQSKPIKPKNEDNGKTPLPDELLMEIFMFMKGKDVAKHVEPVCKHWKHVSSSNVVWNVIYHCFNEDDHPRPRRKRNQIGQLGNNNQVEQPKEEEEDVFAKVYNMHFDHGSAKENYIVKYLSRYPAQPEPPLSPIEHDYSLGLRYVIRDEFDTMLRRNVIAGIFTLPWKLMFIGLLPVYVYFNLHKRAEMMALKLIAKNFMRNLLCGIPLLLCVKPSSREQSNALKIEIEDVEAVQEAKDNNNSENNTDNNDEIQLAQEQAENSTQDAAQVSTQDAAINDQTATQDAAPTNDENAAQDAVPANDQSAANATQDAATNDDQNATAIQQETTTNIGEATTTNIDADDDEARKQKMIARIVEMNRKTAQLFPTAANTKSQKNKNQKQKQEQKQKQREREEQAKQRKLKKKQLEQQQLESQLWNNSDRLFAGNSEIDKDSYYRQELLKIVNEQGKDEASLVARALEDFKWEKFDAMTIMTLIEVLKSMVIAIPNFISTCLIVLTIPCSLCFQAWRAILYGNISDAEYLSYRTNATLTKLAGMKPPGYFTRLMRFIVKLLMRLLSVVVYLPIGGTIILGIVLGNFFYPVRITMQEFLFEFLTNVNTGIQDLMNANVNANVVNIIISSSVNFSSAATNFSASLFNSTLASTALESPVISQYLVPVYSTISSNYFISWIPYLIGLSIWIMTKVHKFNFKFQYYVIYYVIMIGKWLISWLISWDGYITKILFFVYSLFVCYRVVVINIRCT